jgi:hypothetical protein
VNDVAPAGAPLVAWLRALRESIGPDVVTAQLLRSVWVVRAMLPVSAPLSVDNDAVTDWCLR